jgi:hypothetical protein
MVVAVIRKPHDFVDWVIVIVASTATVVLMGLISLAVVMGIRELL